MFEHLDDPDPWLPDTSFRERAARSGRTRRRRRRLGTGGAITVVALVAGSFATGAWARRQLDGVQRVEIAGDVLGGGPDANLGTPSVETILLTNVDTRTDLSGAETDGVPRTDAIAVARLDHEHGTLRVVAIPRDLAVPTAPGPSIRINVLRGQGGPEALITQVESLLDVPIDHYAELDFAGFTALVDQVGGITVDVAAPMRDAATGLDLAAGCAHLDGAGVLALARSRHLEVLGPDGVWLGDTTGDLGRIIRQQVVAGLLWRSVVELTPSPGDVAAMAALAGDHLVVDAGTSDADLLRWARFGLALDPDQVGQTILATTPFTDASGAMMLQADQAQLDAAHSFLVDATRTEAARDLTAGAPAAAVVAPTQTCLP